MATIDPVELGKWERGETDRGKFARFMRGFWHNFFPKLSGWTLTPTGFLLGFLRVFSLLAIGLLPTLLKLLDQTQISWLQVGLITFGMAVALIYNHFYDRYEKRKRVTAVRKELRRKLSLEIAHITGGLTKILKVRKRELLPDLETASGRVLACIRNAARIHLGDFEGAHLEATLMLFEDAQCERIKLTSRTTSSRPAGKVKPSKEVMAYYVARSRNHRIVDDFLNDPHPFPRSSLSGGPPNYRSILMIPLLDFSSGGPDSCLGVVTLDSSRPYHFWPGNASELVVELNPFLFLLTLFVNLNNPHRLNFPET